MVKRKVTSVRSYLLGFAVHLIKQEETEPRAAYHLSMELSRNEAMTLSAILSNGLGEDVEGIALGVERAKLIERMIDATRQVESK